MENTNFKKILFLCLPIVFAVALAITLAACMAQANKSLDDSMLGDGTEDTTDGGESIGPPDDVVNVSSSLSALEFKSNGDGTCLVGGIGKCTDSTVKIPETSPDGDRVVGIADSAFLGCRTIKQVSFPSTLTKIGGYAFYGSSLESVTLLEDITFVGECAFANCDKLIAVTVVSDNKNYSSLDGVLFSKDKSEIICYPSGKTNSSYTVRAGVTKIHKMAFYNCPALKTINFNGTEDEWNEIEIGANNNAISSAKLNFPSSEK